jgi:pyrimidine-nucleoside phosphorylase
MTQLAEHPDDETMAEIVRLAPNLSDREVARLAKALADSGSLLELDGPYTDLASTGGPSSLSTLICPLFLCSLGFKVPALGVPGRPAGGVDVLSTIPGYRVHLVQNEVLRILDECAYAHFLADDVFAPADALLFQYRQRTGAQAEPALVIASLLSKKLALNLKTIGLDVRVANFGNFGTTWEVARSNAARFQRVAAIIGIRATCFLTDASFPYQPFIGRGESLVALDLVFREHCEGTLLEHISACWLMAQTIAEMPDAQPPSGKLLRDIFDRNLAAQGARPEAFDERVAQTLGSPQIQICSNNDGFLKIDLDGLRNVLVKLQQRDQGASQFPDPAGVVLLKKVGERVIRGQAIARLRIRADSPEIGEIQSLFTCSGSTERGRAPLETLRPQN